MAARPLITDTDGCTRSMPPGDGTGGVLHSPARHARTRTSRPLETISGDDAPVKLPPELARPCAAASPCAAAATASMPLTSPPPPLVSGSKTANVEPYRGYTGYFLLQTMAKP
ncbi:hypothetical protein Vretimale_12982 [Volvox reticuliferus]|uniref:Uncharacterized protein n=1 Tax=Volvox reticuliferus TaxID=1737510 RepID=A0A8J4CEH4_9CHLO|nr:hypothetical protein Vretifemale_9369 [Volvox reticuliferus]GIM09123.1 hypothetical protein Vretimale_12982 [Volvox reticuliferus]